LEIAHLVMRRTPRAIEMKLKRRGVVVKQEFSRTTTTAIRSKGRFAREKTLKSLAGAIEVVRKPGQDRLELQRLRILVDMLQTYDAVLEKVERWVEIANRLMELDKKLAELEKADILCRLREHCEGSHYDLSL